MKLVKRSSLARWSAGAVLLALLVGIFVLDSVTATLGYPLVAGIAALITGALHPEADGRLARWALKHGLRTRVGATPETYPEYFEAKRSTLLRAALVTIVLLTIAIYVVTR